MPVFAQVVCANGHPCPHTDGVSETEAAGAVQDNTLGAVFAFHS